VDEIVRLLKFSLDEIDSEKGDFPSNGIIQSKVFFRSQNRSGKNSGAIFVATMFSDKIGYPTDNKITI
jgi:hypothetical protein